MEYTYQKQILDCPIDHEGQTIQVHCFKTKDSPHPPYILAHDLGEGLSDLSTAIEVLKRKQANIYVFEIRGYSKEVRVKISLETIINDFIQVLALTKHNEANRKPIFVAQGTSCICTIMVAKLLAQHLEGIALFSPTFALRKKLATVEVYTIRLLVKFFPWLVLPRSIQSKFIGSKKRTITATLASDILDAIPQVAKNLNRVFLPCLIVYPSYDPVCKYEFLKRIKSKQHTSDKITLHTIFTKNHSLISNSNEDIVENSIKQLIHWTESTQNF